jgi:hypothetical protein
MKEKEKSITKLKKIATSNIGQIAYRQDIDFLDLATAKIQTQKVKKSTLF